MISTFAMTSISTAAVGIAPNRIGGSDVPRQASAGDARTASARVALTTAQTLAATEREKLNMVRCDAMHFPAGYLFQLAEAA
jgi:hypothetical protein